MGLSTAVHDNECIGARVSGDVRPPIQEYRFPVYCHLVDTESISSGRATYGGAGIDDIVGSGRP